MNGRFQTRKGELKNFALCICRFVSITAEPITDKVSEDKLLLSYFLLIQPLFHLRPTHFCHCEICEIKISSTAPVQYVLLRMRPHLRSDKAVLKRSRTRFKSGLHSVEKISDMPEVTDFVPELVCLGIDVAICGVISQS